MVTGLASRQVVEMRLPDHIVGLLVAGAVLLLLAWHVLGILESGDEMAVMPTGTGVEKLDQ